MAFNQIAFQGMPAAARNVVFQQNTGQQAINQVYGGAVPIALAPSESCLIPAGQWITQAGPYTDVQYYDAASQMWRNIIGADVAPIPLSSDGTNYRFVNLSGCPVGAVVTTAGTTIGASAPVQMYTPTGLWQGGSFTAQTTLGLTCTASAGGSTWNTFIGGAVNTSVTITNGGTLYTYPPKVVVVPPAAQGSQPFLPASVVCGISGGAVNSVTVINQGAGYVSAPTLLILNQPGDTTGSGCVLTAALTGTGQVTAVMMNTPGSVQTSTPTLAFAGSGLPSSAAATVLMNYSLTNAGAGTVTAGSGYTNGYTLVASTGQSTATAVYTNPAYEKGICTFQQPLITSASSTVVGLNNAASINIFYGTGFQVAPTLNPIAGVITTGGAIVGPTVGGQNDVCLQFHGGYGFACEYDVERKFRETRLYQVAPISTNLILSYVAEHVLGLPRSF